MTQKYTVEAPIGNVLAPIGKITEEELRDFGASISAEETWREKFKSDPIEEVLGYFKTAGFKVEKL